MRLNAAASRLRPGVRGVRLSYRWRLLSAPPGSRWRQRGGRVRRLPLRIATRARPPFTPDARGRYRLSLRVGDGVRSRADTATFTAVGPSPLVPVETMATNSGGDWGIRVGGNFYAAGTAANSRLQVVVLDRKSLGSLSGTPTNATLACADVSDCVDKLNSLIGDLQDNAIVVVSSQPGYSDWHGLLGALAPIGVSKNVRDDAASTGGAFSAVGIPGLQAGEADQLATPAGTAADPADMDGYLTFDQYDSYVWEWGDHPVLDTSAATSTTQNVNTMQIGDLQIQSGPWDPQTSAGVLGGFQLVILDPQTFDYKSYLLATNTGGGDPTDGVINQKVVTALLANSIYPNELVLLQGVGDPVAQLTSDWNDMAAQIQAFGGTADTVNSLVDEADYAFVGWTGARPAEGLENTAIDPDVAQQVGFLSRSEQGLLLPGGTDPTNEGNYALIQTAFQAPTAWPLAGDSGAQTALSWIGVNANIGSDPRSAYWMQDWTGDKWGSAGTAVKNVSYESGHGFGKTDFNTAQQELEQEILWVASVRDYVANLSAPFDGSLMTSWTTAQTTADSVQSAVSAPTSADAGFDVEDLMFAMLEVLGVQEELEIPAEVMTGIYELGLAFTSQDQSGAPVDQFQSEVDNLGATLVGHLQDAQTSVQNLGDIVVADYGKLKTVGTLGGCVAGSTNCTPQWQWTQADATASSTAIVIALKREAYRSLLPLKFDAWVLPDIGQLQPNFLVCDLAITGYDNGSPITTHSDESPFANVPQGAYTEFTNSNLPGLLPSVSYWVVASSITHDQVKPPGQTLMAPLFQPLDPGGNPNAGGLGLEPEEFYLRTFYNPAQGQPRSFPHQQSWYVQPDTYTLTCPKN